MQSRIIYLVCFISVLVNPLNAQSVRPYKDMVFGQVAAGGGYESWITVTNRGTEPYTGSLFLYRSKAQPWNPKVDGNTITDGKVALSVPSGATRTLKVSGSQTTESGFAAFVGDNLLQTSFLEGNLTYITRTGNVITDSVGVTPSSEFYISTVPFEDLLTVALALVNRAPNAASVRLEIYSETNTQVASRTIALLKNEQYVRFLWEEFGRLTTGRGRLEIHSDVPIVGTALMFSQNQSSSLPLLPALRSYSVVITSKGLVSKGQISLWAEGPYFNGLFVATDILGVPISPESALVSGQVSQGKLKLLVYVGTTEYTNPEVFGVATSVDTFSFDSTKVDLVYYGAALPRGRVQSGTFSITRTN